MGNPFFAFDNGAGRDDGWPPAKQAEVLKQLGYDGIGYTGTEDFAGRRKAFAEQGLRIFTLYVPCFVDKPEPYAPHLKEAVRPLDEGKFDVAGFLRSLGAAGYRGPVGLQCYQIPGAPEEHLKRSITRWKEIRRLIAGPAKP